MNDTHNKATVYFQPIYYDKKITQLQDKTNERHCQTFLLTQ
jgi:hypothetical protein